MLRLAIALAAFALAGCFPTMYSPYGYGTSDYSPYYGGYWRGYPYSSWAYRRHDYDDCDSDSHGYHHHRGGRYEPRHPPRRVLRPQRRQDDPAGHPGSTPKTGKPPAGNPPVTRPSSGKPTKDAAPVVKPWKSGGPPSAKRAQPGPGPSKQPLTRAPRASIPGASPARGFHAGGLSR